jgi:GTP-binding protein
MAIKITSALFTACITSKDGLPEDNLPIIALVGRSNVGKSSLINSVANRRELARTSSMPGKTLTINFYNINEQFYIVDLPGYGYAKASKVTRQRIQGMMNEFFAECKNLKGVIQILDSRHKPSTLDVQMYEWLRDQKFNYLAVLTKVDKLSNQMAIKMKKAILKDLGLNFALSFSSQTLTGKEEFLDAVEKILAGYQFKSAETRPPRSRQPGRKEKGPDKKGAPGKGPGNNQGRKNETEKSASDEKSDRTSKPGQPGQPGKKVEQGQNKPGTGKRRRRRPRKPGGVGNKNGPGPEKPAA